jgi:hypothetical protein
MNSPTYNGGTWKVVIDGVEVPLTPEQVSFSPTMESILRDQLAALSSLVTKVGDLSVEIDQLTTEVASQNTILAEQRDLISALKNRAENPSQGLFMGQRYTERRLTAEAVEASYPGKLFDIMGVSTPGELPRD